MAEKAEPVARISTTRRDFGGSDASVAGLIALRAVGFAASGLFQLVAPVVDLSDVHGSAVVIGPRGPHGPQASHADAAPGALTRRQRACTRCLMFSGSEFHHDMGKMEG
jgi:hypothetical protein